jgi:ATP-dependent Clp endopeptidase proteolytic subunit ClpP
MPITPNEDETKVDFITRCMSDEGTTKEYSDEEDREEYCTLQFNEANPQEDVEEAEAEDKPTNEIAVPKEGEDKETFMERCVTDEYDNEMCSISWDENQPEEEEEEVVENTQDIFIYDMIGSGGLTAKQVVNELSKAGKTTPINLRINSAGGDVFEGIAIYNSLKKHQGHITVEIEGLAASMASVIMLAGDEVSASENSLIMIHNPSVGIQGDAKDLTKKAELLDKIKEQMVDIYSTRTGIKDTDIIEMMNAETWFTATEAMEQGFISNIGEPIKVAAVNETVFSNAPSWVVDFKKKQNPNIMDDILGMLTNLKNRISGIKEDTPKGVRILDDKAVKRELVNLSQTIGEAVNIQDELVDTLSIVATHESTIEILNKELQEKVEELNKLNATPTSDKVLADKDPSLNLKGDSKETNGWNEAMKSLME